jgi:S-methylmethionine-dependent homocysteine/selenocysteine methylase
MAKFRTDLPQLGGDLFLTDGGIETTLIFHEKLDLPQFAAFHLLRDPSGRAALRQYFQTYASLASRLGMGLILESATWRASDDWASKLGYSPVELLEANRRSIRLLEEIRKSMPANGAPIVISGCIGPRGDGYVPGETMQAREAEAFHRKQVETFAETAADMVSAITMNYVEEAIGIARAAERAEMPVAIAFTVETDGRLATGETLASAVRRTDAATSSYPVYYMVNCAHPSHFEHVFDGGDWTQRIRSVRANASCRSHSELNDAADLDAGDPAELAAGYVRLKRLLPMLNVMGGCCGTDHRHIEKIAEQCAPLFRYAAVGTS